MYGIFTYIWLTFMVPASTIRDLLISQMEVPKIHPFSKVTAVGPNEVTKLEEPGFHVGKYTSFMDSS